MPKLSESLKRTITAKFSDAVLEDESEPEV